MSIRTDDSDPEYRTVGTDATELEPYEDVQLGDGQVIIYDEDNESAWIQSPSAIGLEFMI
jgi:hypothetical protein